MSVDIEYRPQAGGQLNITDISVDCANNPAPSVASDSEIPTTPPPAKSSEGLNKKKRCRIPQQWTVDGGIAKTDIGFGHIAIVDAGDLHLVRGRKWYPFFSGEIVYAAHGKGIFMHRLILGAGEGTRVDHRHHNGLDNRRENLRLTTQSNNQANRRKHKAGTSKFKGVRLLGDKWLAACNRKHIGCFSNEVAAAMAYDAWALETWGEFAHTNFPTPNFQNV